MAYKVKINHFRQIGANQTGKNVGRYDIGELTGCQGKFSAYPQFTAEMIAHESGWLLESKTAVD